MTAPETWIVYWAPEGRPIATVEARTAREACRKAIRGTRYRKYPGEVRASQACYYPHHKRAWGPCGRSRHIACHVPWQHTVPPVRSQPSGDAGATCDRGNGSTGGSGLPRRGKSHVYAWIGGVPVYGCTYKPRVVRCKGR